MPLSFGFIPTVSHSAQVLRTLKKYLREDFVGSFADNQVSFTYAHTYYHPMSPFCNLVGIISHGDDHITVWRRLFKKMVITCPSGAFWVPPVGPSCESRAGSFLS